MEETTSTTPKTTRPTLHRSRRDHLLFGVCGGLGEYFGIDPVLIRLMFALVTLAGGAGILAYIVLAIVMPEEGAAPITGRDGLQSNLADLQASATSLGADLSARSGSGHGWTRGQELAGFILIGLGVLFLAGNLGWLGWFNWSIFWPVVLILLGVVIVVRHQRDE